MAGHPSHCLLQRPAHLLCFLKGRSEFVLSWPVFCKNHQVLVATGAGDKEKVAISCKAISMGRAWEESEPVLEQGKELLARFQARGKERLTLQLRAWTSF